MITPEQSIKIFKNDSPFYKGHKIDHIYRADGYGYIIHLTPPVYTGLMGVNFDGHYQMFDISFFDDNDPFHKTNIESFDYILCKKSIFTKIKTFIYNKFKVLSKSSGKQ